MTATAPTIDTIAAVATAKGCGGIGIVRVSGPLSKTIAAAVLGRTPGPRRAELRNFLDQQGSVLDRGIALYFPAPNSYTGEDVLELQGHGGPAVLDLLLLAVLALGARVARPGEFTERAYLNDKMDLTQAEAVADLIDSATHGAARSASRSLTGMFSQRCHQLSEQVGQLRAHVEAAIDFPEDEVDFLADQSISNQLNQIIDQLTTVRGQAQQGQILRDGINLVLVGAPNVGKSSLLNALTQQDRAIVSTIAGTTRDTLTETIELEGVPLHIVDTAGLRQAGNEIEAEGIRRTHRAAQSADLALVVIDSSIPGDWKNLVDSLPPGLTTVYCWNKSDLVNRPLDTHHYREQPDQHLALSAKTGVGLEQLKAVIKHHAGLAPIEGSVFSARRRHLKALDEAHEHSNRAQQLLAKRQGELVAEELRLIQSQLGAITGETSNEDLLGQIFSSFCIGK